LSIILLAILAVMWVAFLLPVIAPRQGPAPSWMRRRIGGAGDGWRPSPDPPVRGARRSGAGAHGRSGVGTGRSRPAASAAGRSVLRRRRVLLGLTLAAVASIRVRYVLGGHWWIAEAVAGALLSAYVVALVAQGFRRGRQARVALPPPAARRALPPPPTRQVAPAMRQLAPPPLEPGSRRWPRWRRRLGEGRLWGAPLLEGQGPPSPE
jgi:hypothetical protein